MKIKYISIMSRTGVKYVLCDNPKHDVYPEIKNLSDITLNQLWNLSGYNLEKDESKQSLFTSINTAIDTSYQLRNDLKDLDFSTMSVETLQLDLTKPNIELENVTNIYSEFHTYKINAIIDRKLCDADVVFLDLLETVMIRRLTEDQNKIPNDKTTYPKSTTPIAKRPVPTTSPIPPIPPTHLPYMPHPINPPIDTQWTGITGIVRHNPFNPHMDNVSYETYVTTPQPNNVDFTIQYDQTISNFPNKDTIHLKRDATENS